MPVSYFCFVLENSPIPLITYSSLNHLPLKSSLLKKIGAFIYISFGQEYFISHKFYSFPSIFHLTFPFKPLTLLCKLLLAVDYFEDEERLIIIDPRFELFKKEWEALITFSSKTNETLDACIIVRDPSRRRSNAVGSKREFLLSDSRYIEQGVSRDSPCIYWFAKGKYLLESAEETIKNNHARGDIESLSSCFNQLVLLQKKVKLIYFEDILL